MSNLQYGKEFQEKAIEDSSNLLSNMKCNYVDCNFNSLVAIKCGDILCNSWFHHICQNEYDCAKYDNGFDSMHSVKNRCRVCVDKIMETLSKGIETENKNIHKLLNNKPDDIIDIDEDNEEADDVETDDVSNVIINEVTNEVTYDICVDTNSKVIQNEIHMNKYGVEENS